MDKAARKRWTILLGVLALTVGAIFYPLDKTRSKGEVVGLARSATPSVAGGASITAPSALEQLAQPVPDDDPFSPRGWQAPPPPEPKKVVPVVIAPVAPPAPVTPPLPFKFMGRFNDGDQQVLYLSLGDKTLIVHNGDALEGGYKVLGIHAQGIEFEYGQTGDKQTLPLPATDN